MKNKALSIILFLLFSPFAAPAQDVIHHQRGEDLQHYLLDSVKFVVPEFLSGIVTFADGSFARGPLNISTVEQRVYFISPEGEYQVLTDEDKVSRVSIGGRSFVKSKYGYAELLQAEGDVILAAVRRTSFFETEKKGAYGMASQTTAVSTVHSIQQGGVLYTLDIEKSTPFKYKTIPYLCRNGRLYISNRKNFQKCFPDRKEAISRYLSEHGVDFESLEDVRGLFEAISAR